MSLTGRPEGATTSVEPPPAAAEHHVLDRLVDYFSGALKEEDEIAVEAHIFRCAPCRIEFDTLGHVALMVTAIPPGLLEVDGEILR